MADELQPWIYLRERREELRKTRTEIALAAGISKTYYCQIERGRRQARNPQILGAIADALGVPILKLTRDRDRRASGYDTPKAVAS